MFQKVGKEVVKKLRTSCVAKIHMMSENAFISDERESIRKSKERAHRRHDGAWNGRVDGMYVNDLDVLSP